MQIITASMDELMPLVREQLRSGSKARLAVTGTSMTPLLRSGKDSVLLRPVAVTPVKRDIILYRRKNGSYVLHRVVGLQDEALLCCGDNQWRKESVSPEQVEAVVCALYRKEKLFPQKGLRYQIYVNHLPLRRLYCRLRDHIFRKR